MSSLSQQLSSPLSSVEQLSQLLIPYLNLLHLLPDRQDLVSTTDSNSSSTSTVLIQEVSLTSTSSVVVDVEVQRSTFIKRQLGLVQKVLIEIVWPNWERAIQEENESLIEVLFQRWFIPPLPQEEENNETSRRLAVEIAISSYAILNSLLNLQRTPTTSSPLQLQSLTIITRLLSQLTSIYTIDLLYSTIFEEAKDERSLTKASVRWDLVFKDVYTLPTKLSNAWGKQWELQPSLVNLKEVIPNNLDWSIHCGNITVSYAKLLLSLSCSTISPITTSIPSLALPLLSFPPSFYSTSTSSTTAISFFQSFIPPLISTLLPSFPTSTKKLIYKQNFKLLWQQLILEELSERELERFIGGLINHLEISFFSTSILKKNGSKIIDEEEERSEEKKKIKAAIFLLLELVGPISIEDQDGIERFNLISSILITKRGSWSRGMATVLPEWIISSSSATSTSSSKEGEEKTLIKLMDSVMKIWSDEESIKIGSESSRLYLTTLLLVTVISLPPLHPSIISLSHSKPFLLAISLHLSLLKPTIRYLGMLVAEIISSQTAIPNGVGALTFGDIWIGNEEGKEIIRNLRNYLETFRIGRGGGGGKEKKLKLEEGWQEIIKQSWSLSPSPFPSHPISSPSSILPSKSISQPISLITPISAQPSRPLISIIDPDDLTPFPLPPSPSPAYLSTLNSTDPSLYASALPNPHISSTRKRGKLRSPVYIPELVAYLKGKEAEEGKEEKEDEIAERVEVGLKEGEELIRRKRGWGGELAENSVDLAFVLMGLQDQFELENFDQFKQKMLTALVFCCPTLVAPAIVEQYYSRHYTINQRYMLLTALALGARELAGLPTIAPSQIANTPTPISTPSIDLFPSKRLPPALHRKLIGGVSTLTPPSASITLTHGALEDLTEELTRTALSDAKSEAETTLPLAAKEKLLTVRRFASAPSTSTTSKVSTSNQSSPTFSTLSSEYFIIPLINRFWLYLRDTSTSPSTNSSSPYSGGRSTPTLLEPLILSKYFGTLSVLLHASRYSPHFLAVLVPETLELVLALRVQTVEESDEIILGSQMELILTGLDSSVLIDGGKTLMGLKEGKGAEIVGECREWAEVVFEMEEMKGGNGKGEGIGRTGRAAAGVLLRIEEIFTRWRGRVGY